MAKRGSKRRRLIAKLLVSLILAVVFGLFGVGSLFFGITGDLPVWGRVLFGVFAPVGLLAGAALLVDSVLVDERATAQGTVDVLMDIAAVVGSLGSGLAVALGGIEAIAIPTTLALLFFPVVRALRRSRWRLSR